MNRKTGNDLFIVDNSDNDWKVLNYLSEWSDISSRFDIATGYFEIGALLALDGKWQKLDHIRILMGDEVTHDKVGKVFINGEGQLTVSVPNAPTVSHAEKTTVGLSDLGSGGRVELWELVHWYYAGHKDITAGILKAMRAAFANFQTDIEPGLELNALPAATALTLTWIQNNFKAVAATYKNVMRAHNATRIANGDPPIPDNHNVASLCLYSGLVPTYLKLEQYRSWPQPPGYWYSEKFGFYAARHIDKPHYRNAWLATGDAMLKKPAIWNDFEHHFGLVRLEGCLTVQIPHHDADAPSSDNYNPHLIRANQNCVISAGANSKDRHPHKDVVKDILAKPALLRLVNESEPMGFMEFLKFQLK